MRIYIDGIFDLFHYGHLESFKKCKKLDSHIYLIVDNIFIDIGEMLCPLF